MILKFKRYSKLKLSDFSKAWELDPYLSWDYWERVNSFEYSDLSFIDQIRVFHGADFLLPMPLRFLFWLRCTLMDLGLFR